VALGLVWPQMGLCPYHSSIATHIVATATEKGLGGSGAGVATNSPISISELISNRYMGPQPQKQALGPEGLGGLKALGPEGLGA